MDIEPAFSLVDCDVEDTDGPPLSGYEYLKRVQQEAAQCPQVVVADIDTKSFLDKQTVKISLGSGLVAAPGGLQPSVDWQKQQVAAFAELRQGLARYATKHKDETLTQLPERLDKKAWFRFCFGDDARWTQESRDVEQMDSSAVEHDENSGVIEQADKHAQGSQEPQQSQEGMPPLLSIVTRMDPLTVMQVLEYHIEWFREFGFSKAQGQWLFALLACLDKPLLPDVTSLLRSLARNCADLRSTLDIPEHELVAPLNLIITIVSRYFEQRDLIKDG